MKKYRTIINGKERYLNKKELDYTKKIYGSYETVYIFNTQDFFTISELSNLLGYKSNTVYVKHLRNPERFPVDIKDGLNGVYFDTLFKYWLK